MTSPNGPTTDLTSGRLMARNVGLNLGGWLLPALAALIAVPLLVRGLGDARFGLLALAWTALGYFSILDLGIGRAVTHAVADRVGANGGGERRQEAGAVMWRSVALMLPVGVVGAIALFLLAPWLSHDLLKVPPDLLQETTLAFRVLALAIPFTGMTGAFRGVLEAGQLFGTINALRMPHGVMMFLGPVAVLPFSRSVVPAVLILVATRIALCVGHLFVVRRHAAWPAGARWDAREFGSLLRFSGWMTLSNVISPLMATLDRFVIGAVAGVGVVTYYAAPQELATKLWLFTAALLPVFFPALTTSAASDRDRTAMLFSRMLRITLAILMLPTLVLVMLAPDILRVWLGPAFATNSATVLQLFALAVFVNTLGQGALTLIQSLGRPDITGKYHLAELPFYAILLWWLLPRYGILGAAAAWSVRTVLDTVALLVTCPALLKESRASVTRTFGWLAVTVPVLAGATLVPSLALRLALAALAVPVWGVITWWWILTPEERGAPLRALSAAWPTASR